jgi:hypothetical protein
MKTNYLAVFYFIFGFLTSISMMLQGENLYVVLGGITLLNYFLFTLIEAIEELL